MAPYQILLVDDEPELLDVLSETLRTEGYGVEQTTSGEKAIEMLESKHFHMVLADLSRQPADGLAVLSRTKQLSTAVLVIIMIGNRVDHAAVKAFRMGADDCLIKPFDAEELKFRVARCIEKLEFQKKAEISEAALGKSVTQFQALVESSADHIFLLDHNGNFLFSNNRHMILDCGTDGASKILNLKDVYPADVTRLYKKKMDAVIHTHQPVTFEYATRMKEGRAFHLSTLYPIRDGEDLIGIGGISRDLTATKQLESQLFQAQKMESLGTLVAGVAHEINNPVNLIMFNLPLLQKIWDDLQPVLKERAIENPGAKYGGLGYEFLRKNLSQLINDMDAATNRIANIVKSLKTFSRKSGPAEFEWLNINNAVENAVKLVETTSRKSGVRLVMHLSRDLPQIKGNRQNLEQITLNLVLNAVQAIGHCNGCVEVFTEYESKEGEIHLIVKDNGPGVNPEIADNIFDPFVTDKQIEGGTGLGLSVTYGLVKDHDGEITFKSIEGEGAVFEVKFAVHPKLRPIKILVADDEPSIRKMVIQTLSAVKQTVFEEAANGTEALIKLGTLLPDLLILDVLMPEMDGLEVCRAIKKEPELYAMDVIIITGFTDDPRLKQAARLGFTHIFEKPIDLKLFLTTVNSILDKKRT